MNGRTSPNISTSEEKATTTTTTTTQLMQDCLWFDVLAVTLSLSTETRDAHLVSWYFEPNHKALHQN